MNTVTPLFVKWHGLEVGSIDDLNWHRGRIPVSCSGGYYTEPLGYVLIRGQLPRIPLYDEEQVALVIRDGSEFSRWVPFIVETIRALKETEMETAPEEWQRARVAQEYANGFFAQSINLTEPMPMNTNQDPLSLDEKVLLKTKCTILRFESIVVCGRTHRTMMMGYRLNVMTQAPYLEDWANLPVGVYVIPMYSELRDSSRSIAIVLRNLMGKPVHLQAGRVIAWVVAANIIPEGKPTPELTKKLDEQDPESAPKKLSIEERQKLLMELLRQEGRLDQLADWTPELAQKFECLLMEYHDIFSLDKNDIGCTDAAKHVIELLDKEPFKEKFRQIAPPLLDEVREHLQEMLGGGAIRPSQSAWCNAVVLVWKKDGGLWFCIDFWRLNARTKKDSYPFPRCKRRWNPWSEPGSSQNWIWSPGSGKSKCRKSPGSILPSPSEAWGSLSSSEYLMGCATPQQHSRGWCKTAWGSWIWHMPWYTWMMSLFSPGQKRNTWPSYERYLNASRNMVWSWNLLSATSSGKRLPF